MCPSHPEAGPTLKMTWTPAAYEEVQHMYEQILIIELAYIQVRSVVWILRYIK